MEILCEEMSHSQNRHCEGYETVTTKEFTIIYEYIAK